jgi:hypothetical protein
MRSFDVRKWADSSARVLSPDHPRRAIFNIISSQVWNKYERYFWNFLPFSKGGENIAQACWKARILDIGNVLKMILIWYIFRLGL